jgi:hypothetical protein
LDKLEKNIREKCKEAFYSNKNSLQELNKIRSKKLSKAHIRLIWLHEEMLLNMKKSLKIGKTNIILENV